MRILSLALSSWVLASCATTDPNEPVVREESTSAFAQIANHRSEIGVVTVVSKVGRRTTEFPNIATDVTFTTQRVLRGQPPAHITFPGGQVDDELIVTVGVPEIAAGKTYLAFFEGQALRDAVPLVDATHVSLRGQLVDLETLEAK